MEAVNTSVGQGGFLTALAEKVNSTEAFIIIVMLFIGFGLWKIFGEFKHLMKDREHTAEKRNAESAAMHSELSRQQNEITELRGMLTSHFQIHLQIEEQLKDIKELCRRVMRMEGKLDIVLERNGRRGGKNSTD